MFFFVFVKGTAAKNIEFGENKNLISKNFCTVNILNIIYVYIILIFGHFGYILKNLHIVPLDDECRPHTQVFIYSLMTRVDKIHQ